jgi:hypothetical protein
MFVGSWICTCLLHKWKHQKADLCWVSLWQRLHTIWKFKFICGHFIKHWHNCFLSLKLDHCWLDDNFNICEIRVLWTNLKKLNCTCVSVHMYKVSRFKNKDMIILKSQWYFFRKIAGRCNFVNNDKQNLVSEV